MKMPGFSLRAIRDIPTPRQQHMQTDFQGYLVGVAVIIFDEQNRVLLGFRAKEKLWASFGGRLEFGETVKEGALREVLEELGVSLNSIRNLGFGEGTKPDGTRYVTLYVAGKLPEGQEPILREQQLTHALRWFDARTLPTQMWPKEREEILNFLKLK